MASNPRTLPSGTTLVEPGSEHGLVYRLRQGWTGRVRTLADGRAQIIMLFLPGDLFAVKSMYVRRHPDAVETLSEAVISQVDQRQLRAACDGDHVVATRCTWQVIEEERRLHDWVVALGRGKAEERTAVALLDFRGRLILSGSIAPDALAYDMPLTQEQLGQYLGLSGVHVNRVLRSLREMGAVVLRGGQVVIDDLGALTRLAWPLLDHRDRDTPPATGAAMPRPG